MPQNGRLRDMEECKLTKRPCRAAIKESVDKCKNPIILRDMYQIVELLRKMVDDVEYKELSETEYQRVSTIRNILYLEENEVRGVAYLVSGCAIPRGKQKGKKNHDRKTKK